MRITISRRIGDLNRIGIFIFQHVEGARFTQSRSMFNIDHIEINFFFVSITIRQ